MLCCIKKKDTLKNKIIFWWNPSGGLLWMCQLLPLPVIETKYNTDDKHKTIQRPQSRIFYWSSPCSDSQKSLSLSALSESSPNAWHFIRTEFNVTFPCFASEDITIAFLHTPQVIGIPHTKNLLKVFASLATFGKMLTPVLQTNKEIVDVSVLDVSTI